MARSQADNELISRMQKHGFNREQLIMWLEISDAMSTVALGGADLIKRVFHLRPAQS